MELRIATPQDIPLLAPLFTLGHEPSSQNHATSSLLEIFADREKRQESNSPQQWHLLIAQERKETIEGCIAAGPSSNHAFSGAELLLLAVAPNSFGRRLGKRLLLELKARLKEAETPCLWINSEEKNIRLYTSLGAVEVASWEPAENSGQQRTRLRLALGLPVELETARTRLRRWRSEDLARFAAINGHEKVNQYLPGPLSREQSDLMADKNAHDMNQHGFGFWSVELKPEAQNQLQPAGHFGMVGLGPVENLPSVSNRIARPCLEVAWRLHPKYWGRGLATEAAQRSISYAFDELHIDELVAYTVPQNQASRRVMVKLGFYHDSFGDFEHPKLPPNHPLRKHVLYRRARA